MNSAMVTDSRVEALLTELETMLREPCAPQDRIKARALVSEIRHVAGAPPLSPEPPRKLSSAMIDGLVMKQRQGESWTPSECGELLDAYQSLMEAYHDVQYIECPVSRGAPEWGWLIELREGGTIMWWQGSDVWTLDPNCAVRFARKRDAEQVMEYFDATKAQAVLHGWDGGIR